MTAGPDDMLTRGAELARNGTYAQLVPAEAERAEAVAAARRRRAARNRQTPNEREPQDIQPPPPPPDVDDPGPAEPPPGDDTGGRDTGRGEPTTWEPIDLGPYLRGEIEPITPSVGAHRTDGQRLLYPGLEHAVIAHTSAGKTWFALACATAELLAGHHVVYLHFEESNPASTIERLQRIGLRAATIDRLLLFVAPGKPVQDGWLKTLTGAAPTLVIVDGVNEAMVLHGVKIDLEGWSAVRRRVVVPFKNIGAAVLECDHLPLSADPLRGDAFGTVHKGNVIDGARFALVRKESFGRGRRGVSHLYATKDRPGYLGAGRADDKGNTYLGTLVVDDSPTADQDFLTLHAPKPKDDAQPPADARDPGASQLRADIREEIDALGGFVESRRRLVTLLRKSGNSARDNKVRDALDRLVVDGELTEEPGAKRSVGYRRLVPRLSVSEPSGTPSPQ